MVEVNYKELAKECLSIYPCSVDICVNPYYYTLSNGGSIYCIGSYSPEEVDKLAKVLEEVSNTVFSETGYHTNGLEWFDIFPEDESLFLEKVNKARAELEKLISEI